MPRSTRLSPMFAGAAPISGCVRPFIQRPTHDGEEMTGARGIDRRGFLVSAAAVGGALTLGFDAHPARAASDSAPEITAWIVIARDDTVTIRVARSEMGQGTLTALPM